MTIQVYTFNEQEEKALLAFLERGHYNFKSTETKIDPEEEFLQNYNKDLDAAEAEIEEGQFISHTDVRKFFAQKKKK